MLVSVCVVLFVVLLEGGGVAGVSLLCVFFLWALGLCVFVLLVEGSVLVGLVSCRAFGLSWGRLSMVSVS